MINKQKQWFEKKNWIVSKPKRWRFLSATSSWKKIRESKISLKDALNQQKVMLILLIRHLTRETCPFRSSHWRCSVQNDVLKNFANFTGKHFCWSLFWQKQSLEVFCRKDVVEVLLNFTGKHLSWSVFNKFQHRCFPVKFTKLLKTPILKNRWKRLLLLWIGLQLY